jgi:hypothetical protein
LSSNEAFDKGSAKKLTIGLSDVNLLKRSDTETVLIKEHTKQKTRLIHICDTYDVMSVKVFKDDRT